MSLRFTQTIVLGLLLPILTACSVRIRSATNLSTASQTVVGTSIGPMSLNASVNSILSLPDGGTLAVGDFSAINAERAPRIALLNSDGSIDTSMTGITTGFNSLVRTAIPELDVTGAATGKFLVGGTFSQFNGTPVYSIARLNADGSLDTGFGTSLGTPMSSVDAIVQELNPATGLPTGKILIGGDFVDVHGVAAPSGIARLNSDGSVDATYNPGGGLDGAARAILFERDTLTGLPTGKVICMGTFWNYNAVNVPDGLIRLNSDGSLDGTFNPGGSGIGTIPTYPALALEYDVTGLPTGKILAGATAGTYNGVNTGARSILRINSDGSLDPTFDNSATGFENVGAITVERNAAGVPTGKLLAGGFKWVGNYKGAIYRLNGDGSIDNTFNAVGSGFALHIGQLIIDGSTDGSGSRYIIGVKSIVQERDATGAYTTKLYVGGIFTTYNGVRGARNFLRLNSDGSLDNSFTPNTGAGFGASIFNISEAFTGTLPNGKILVSGGFSSYGGTPISYGVAKITSNAQLDPSFSAAGIGFNGEVVTAIAERSVTGALTGKFIIGGQFTEYSGTSVGKIARINSDGSLDTSFNFGGTGFDFSASVKVIKQELDLTGIPTGKFYVGYRGGTYNLAVAPAGILRLNADGTLDTTFNNGGSGTNGYGVYDFVQEPNPATGNPTGNIIIGGLITTYNGSALIPNSLLRLTSSGAYDAGFNGGNAGFDSFVTRIVNEYAPTGLPTGNLVITNSAGTYNGVVLNNGIARITATGALDLSFGSGNGTGFTKDGNSSRADVVIVERDTAGLPTGKFLVGGRFDGYGNQPVPAKLVRLNSDGTLDNSFNTGGTGWSGPVYAITQELDAFNIPTGNILVGGWISGYNSTYLRQGIGRISSNGSPDNIFLGK